MASLTRKEMVQLNEEITDAKTRLATAEADAKSRKAEARDARDQLQQDFDVTPGQAPGRLTELTREVEGKVKKIRAQLKKFRKVLVPEDADE